jgi:radical SAM superfamily enzyme YgiQ (UPF0313 family)
MRVLLVYPEYPETFWNFRHALPFIAKKAVYPPLGLLTVAAMLPSEWELRVIDMNVTALREDDLRWAELVGVSASDIQLPSVREVIARCQALGRPILAGGSLFTAHPDEFAEIDYLVLNEAEVTLPQFLQDFRRGQARHIYTTTELADLHTTPIPRWDLISLAPYVAMNIQLSRGCPYDCEFCTITTLYGRIPRLKSREQILAELDVLYRAGWRGGVFFVDDNFVSHKRLVKEEILPALIDWIHARQAPFVFNSQVPINIADDEVLLTQMAQAGFVAVFIGIESPHEASLAECNKLPNTNRDLLTSIRLIQQHGIQVQAGFIVGFDNDPPTIFERLTDFIQESGIVTAMVGLLNAPHGTRLFQRLQAEGRLLSTMSGDNTDYTLNFIPKMPREFLLQGYQRLIASIYSPTAYYQRVKCLLQDFHPVSRRMWDFRAIYLVTAGRLLLTLGVLEKERVYFWRLVGWTLVHCPRSLPLALTFAAYGFHFRKCFEGHQAAELV